MFEEIDNINNKENLNSRNIKDSMINASNSNYNNNAMFTNLLISQNKSYGGYNDFRNNNYLDYFDFILNTKTHDSLKEKYKNILKFYSSYIDYLIKSSKSDNSNIRNIYIYFQDSIQIRLISVVSLFDTVYYNNTSNISNNTSNNNMNSNTINSSDKFLFSSFPLVSYNNKAALFLIFIINNPLKIVEEFEIEELVNLLPILLELDLISLYEKIIKRICGDSRISNNISKVVNKQILFLYTNHNQNYYLQLNSILNSVYQGKKETYKNTIIQANKSMKAFLESLFIVRVFFNCEIDYLFYVNNALFKYFKDSSLSDIYNSSILKMILSLFMKLEFTENITKSSNVTSNKETHNNNNMIVNVDNNHNNNLLNDITNNKDVTLSSLEEINNISIDKNNHDKIKTNSNNHIVNVNCNDKNKDKEMFFMKFKENINILKSKNKKKKLEKKKSENNNNNNNNIKDNLNNINEKLENNHITNINQAINKEASVSKFKKSSDQQDEKLSDLKDLYVNNNLDMKKIKNYVEDQNECLNIINIFDEDMFESKVNLKENKKDSDVNYCKNNFKSIDEIIISNDKNNKNKEEDNDSNQSHNDRTIISKSEGIASNDNDDRTIYTNKISLNSQINNKIENNNIRANKNDDKYISNIINDSYDSINPLLSKNDLTNQTITKTINIKQQLKALRKSIKNSKNQAQKLEKNKTIICDKNIKMISDSSEYIKNNYILEDKNKINTNFHYIKSNLEQNSIINTNINNSICNINNEENSTPILESPTASKITKKEVKTIRIFDTSDNIIPTNETMLLSTSAKDFILLDLSTSLIKKLSISSNISNLGVSGVGKKQKIKQKTKILIDLILKIKSNSPTFALSDKTNFSILVFNLKNNNVSFTLTGHKDVITCMSNLISEYIISSSNDKTIKIWYLSTQAIYKTIVVSEIINSLLRINDYLFITCCSSSLSIFSDSCCYLTNSVNNSKSKKHEYSVIQKVVFNNTSNLNNLQNKQGLTVCACICYNNDSNNYNQEDYNVIISYGKCLNLYTSKNRNYNSLRTNNNPNSKDIVSHKKINYFFNNITSLTAYNKNSFFVIENKVELSLVDLSLNKIIEFDFKERVEFDCVVLNIKSVCAKDDLINVFISTKQGRNLIFNYNNLDLKVISTEFCLESNAVFKS